MGETTFDCPCRDGFSFAEVDGFRPASERLSFAESFHSKIDFQVHNIDGAHVTDAIGDDYKNWHFRSPVLLDAPTGTGKTTFVCECLIPMAYAHRKHLLLVSNRAALASQQKRSIIKAVKKQDSFLDLQEDTPIDDINFFGRVCVCTYQGFHKLLKKAETDFETNQFFIYLLYSVFDEAHFFYSDATFNDYCDNLLEQLPIRLYHTVRVYMTATSWSIRNSLLKIEQDAHILIKEKYPEESIIGSLPRHPQGIHPLWRTFHHYRMEKDYSPYQLHFFSKDGELPMPGISPIVNKKANVEPTSEKKTEAASDAVITVTRLIPDPSEDHKLLVFVQSKEDGERLSRLYFCMYFAAC